MKLIHVPIINDLDLNNISKLDLLNKILKKIKFYKSNFEIKGLCYILLKSLTEISNEDKYGFLDLDYASDIFSYLNINIPESTIQETDLGYNINGGVRTNSVIYGFWFNVSIIDEWNPTLEETNNFYAPRIELIQNAINKLK